MQARSRKEQSVSIVGAYPMARRWRYPGNEHSLGEVFVDVVELPLVLLILIVLILFGSSIVSALQ